LKGSVLKLEDYDIFGEEILLSIFPNFIVYLFVLLNVVLIQRHHVSYTRHQKFCTKKQHISYDALVLGSSITYVILT